MRTDKSCTAAWCVSGLTVNFSSASGRYAAGTYHLGIVADGVSITCSATLPRTRTSPPTTCSSAGAELRVSGSEYLPASEHALDELLLTTQPHSVSLTITLDSKAFASATLSPTYVTSQPNGPDCEPTCRSAHELVDVP